MMLRFKASMHIFGACTHLSLSCRRLVLSFSNSSIFPVTQYGWSCRQRAVVAIEYQSTTVQPGASWDCVERQRCMARDDIHTYRQLLTRIMGLLKLSNNRANTGECVTMNPSYCASTAFASHLRQRATGKESRTVGKGRTQQGSLR